MKKGTKVLLVLAVSIFVIYLGFISAAMCNIVPNNDCNSSVNGNIVMGLYATTNSHGTSAAYANGTLGTTPYVLCCYNFGSGDTSCSALGNPTHPIYGNSVPDNKIIGLYSSSNSHAEVTGNTNYATNICYSGLECISTSGCTSSYPLKIFNLTSSTNSHISAVSTSGFNIAICCNVPEIGGGTLQCQPSSATWIPTSGVKSGDLVNMSVGGTNCNGASINFTIRDSSSGNLVFWKVATFPYTLWAAQQGSYTFTATGISSGNSATSGTISVAPNAIPNCPNYPNTACSDLLSQSQCNTGYGFCKANTSDPVYKALTDPTNSLYDPSFYSSWCEWNSSSNSCNFNYQDSAPESPPVLCDGTDCQKFSGCDAGYTLCEHSSSGSNDYYCFPGSTCISGDTPQSGGTCGFLEGGCSSAICNANNQDTCAPGTTCLKRSSSDGGGGMCNGTVVSSNYCSDGNCYSNPSGKTYTGGCPNGYSLCSYNSANFCYKGTSCPVAPGVTTPATVGQCESTDSCASAGCLSSTKDNPLKGSCIGDAYCLGGSCYSPTSFSGQCTLKTTTSGNCSQGGFLQLNIKAIWSGDPSKISPSCTDGTRKAECPPQIPLPFFNTYNAIATIAILILIYLALVIARKHYKKGKKSRKKKH